MRKERTELENRWLSIEPIPAEPVELLVRVSNLLGSDTRLVLAGGGNTSVKRQERDFFGKETEVLRVKASGFRMSGIEAGGFAGVRIAELLSLRDRDAMSDEEMVDSVAHALISPHQPRPSIETLLHAWIPHPWVLHTHADPVLSLLNNKFGEERLREIFGNRVIVIPYSRPGFALSKQVAAAVAEAPDAEGLLLLNHGLVTWGEDAKTAYDRHIGFVNTAEAFINQHRGNEKSEYRLEVEALEDDVRKQRASLLAPILRGALKKGASDPLLLAYDDSSAALNFLAREDLPKLAKAIPATPEHLLSLKPFAMVLSFSSWDDAETLKQQVRAAVTDYRESYQAYVSRNGDGSVNAHHDSPRVILVPGIGIWTTGEQLQEAEFSREAFQHTMRIMLDAQGIGAYTPLNEKEMFRAEYWPLELYKLSNRKRSGELYGRIVLITGGAKGIGFAVARLCLQEGACVCIADIDKQAMEQASARLSGEFSTRVATVYMDVTEEQSVKQAVLEAAARFGGLDVLVSNAGIAPFGSIQSISLKDWERSFDINSTGHFLVSRSAVRMLLDQGHGGSLVFINTKNVPAPGKDFGAYSCAKASEAQLCRILAIEHGSDKIRSNMINPDSIITDLWTPEMKENRAKAYGVKADEFEEFLRSRSLLKETVTVEDVAQAALFLASDRSRITTGCIVSVDAGSREAFPR
jgi:rhamnulose-1-phosphate aldolase/alcohol dehydrogenase